MGKATQDLRKEHEAILYVLQILDRMMQPAGEPATRLRYYEEALYFLQIFADKCHHGKEEDHLFPALIDQGISNQGGSVGVMLQEHAQGRDYMAQMGRSLEEQDAGGFNSAADQYCDLLRRHIEKENNVLFLLADQVLDEQAQERIFEQFEQHEETVIGHGVHERLHAMIDTWAKAFGLE